MARYIKVKGGEKNKKSSKKWTKEELRLILNIQSTEKKCFDEPDSEHYHTIITIPWKHVNTIQTKVVINDR